MADYTLEMFIKDHDDLLPTLRVLRDVEFPEDEWPQVAAAEPVGEEFGLGKDHTRRIIAKLEEVGLVKVVSGGYRINPNNPDSDTFGAFRIKYGPKATDFTVRFLSVMRFINHNRDRLKKEGLIRNAEKGALWIDEDMVRVMLDSFQPPELPSRFPTSPLCNKYCAFILNRVLKALGKKKPSV